MADQLLIRDIPKHIQDWIDDEIHTGRKTKKEFVLSILENAYGINGQLKLFEPLPPILRETQPENIPFTFIDLFAGIGGMRFALERLGGKCVYTCERDKYCQKTYYKWFGDIPKDDIRELDYTKIPDHDILAAGFPCQPFSIAGVSKKKSLGREHGFKCASQGNLFFSLATIIEIKRPPVLLLENVKNLKSHDQGKTWAVIRETLESLNYQVFVNVIDAANYVPQHRERVFIVCFDKKVFGNKKVDFKYPRKANRKFKSVLDILDKNVDSKYILSNHLWSYLQEYAKKHRERGNGFGFGLPDLSGITRTLSARYYKDGSEILIKRKNGNPRRLTPREAARLMGFDENLPIVVSDTQAYKQFGNAVVPAMVEDVGRQILKVISRKLLKRGNGCLLKKVTG